MADTPKLSVEKALEKLQGNQAKSKSQLRDEKTEQLSEEIRRMKAQRQRLDRAPGKRS